LLNIFAIIPALMASFAWYFCRILLFRLAGPQKNMHNFSQRFVYYFSVLFEATQFNSSPLPFFLLFKEQNNFKVE